MPGTKEKRRVGLALFGVVMVAGAAFGFWYVLDSVDQRSSYVVAARDINRWDRVSSSDFRVVLADIGDGAAAKAPQMGNIYGRWATGSIPAGTFITEGMFQDPPLSGPADADRVVIQVSLPSSEVAYGTLATGDTVALLGREPIDPLVAELLGDEGGDLEGEYGLIDVLTLDFVQGDNIIYVVTPQRALEIESLVARYQRASDRRMWKLGIDLTEDDIEAALEAFRAGDS